MKVTVITCDNCGEMIEKAIGNEYPVTLKIKGYYCAAIVVLHANRHLCDDCWADVIRSGDQAPK